MGVKKENKRSNKDGNAWKIRLKMIIITIVMKNP